MVAAKFWWRLGDHGEGSSRLEGKSLEMPHSYEPKVASCSNPVSQGSRLGKFSSWAETWGLNWTRSVLYGRDMLGRRREVAYLPNRSYRLMSTRKYVKRVLPSFPSHLSPKHKQRMAYALHLAECCAAFVTSLCVCVPGPLPWKWLRNRSFLFFFFFPSLLPFSSLTLFIEIFIHI